MDFGFAGFTVFQVLRGALPTLADAARGPVAPDTIDRRCKHFAQAMVARARIQLHVTGQEQCDATRACVIMSNHQSHLDIPVLYAALPLPRIRMVAKAELFKIPIFGHAMRRGGFVEVNRRNRAQSIDALQQAAVQIRQGTTVWIAPEGSRSKDGAVGALKKGGFHLAKQAGVDILPVAISGTHDVLPPHATRVTYDVPVYVHIGAPIATAEKSVEQLQDSVHAFLVRHVASSRSAGY